MANESQSDPYERGAAKLREVYAGDVVDLPEGTMAFNDVMIKTIFAEVWDRDVLSIRDRRLLLMGVIAAQGQADVWRIQAKSSLRNAELTPDELRETLVMLAPYAGYPNVAGLVVACEEVIGEVEVAEDPVMTLPLGYVGLGDMGGAMAEHLVDDGFDVHVHDLSADAVTPLVEAGAIASASAAEVADLAAHVGVCVPADEHVVEVVTGSDGLLAGARPGASIAVHSTVRPATVVELAAVAADQGVILFDAGVAGGADKARRGELAITVGMPEAGLPDAARAALDACGGVVVECGPVGTGLATKIAVNVMTYLQFAGISSAFEVVQAGGGDPEAVLDVLRHNDMLGALTEQFSAVPRMSLDDKTAEGFAPYLWATIGLAEKDLQLAADLSPDDAGPRPILEAVRDGMWRVYGMGGPRSRD